MAEDKARKKHQGIRSEASRAVRRAKYLAKRKEKKVKSAVEQELYSHPIDNFPTEFWKAKPDGARVRKLVKKNYTTSPDDLETLQETGKIVVPLQDLPSSIEVPNGLPPDLMIRFDHFIPAKVQKRLRIRWDAIIASGAQHSAGKRDANRSATDAFHFGIWEVSSALPHLTADTSTSHQSPKAIAAIDSLLQYIGDFIAPKIGSVFKQHAPTHWEAMQKAYERVKLILATDLLERPSLDLGGNFFSVAVKEGGSGLVHIDWNDSKAIWCFVFAVGDWEGGEFCAPQLGIKIPIRPGQVFAVLARVVAHFSAPVTNGRRIVFTCFTDSLAFSHANPDFVIG